MQGRRQSRCDRHTINGSIAQGVPGAVLGRSRSHISRFPRDWHRAARTGPACAPRSRRITMKRSASLSASSRSSRSGARFFLGNTWPDTAQRPQERVPDGSGMLRGSRRRLLRAAGDCRRLSCPRLTGVWRGFSLHRGGDMGHRDCRRASQFPGARLCQQRDLEGMSSAGPVGWARLGGIHVPTCFAR